MRFKATIEYDGTDFHGWQRQLSVRTVQEEVESTLSQIANEAVTVIGSGRTDTGVHAAGQVAHFNVNKLDLSVERLLISANSLLPSDVKIVLLEEVTSIFHARFKAVSRTYRYRIEREFHPLRCRYCWSPKYDWDDLTIQNAALQLIGVHGFRSFCRERPGEEEYKCKIYRAEWKADRHGATFEIRADRYFHRMVRGIVGALYDVGRGQLAPDDFINLLENPISESNVTMAPPQGLTLMEVRY